MMPKNFRNILISRRIIPATVIILLGLLVFTYWHVKSRGSDDSSSVTNDPSPVSGSLIKTALPAMHAFTLKIPWTGTVKAQASVDLIALVAGRVEAIYAVDQTHIEKGQPVMKLGGSQIEDAHVQLLAEIESLKRQLDLTRQTVKWHKETLENRLSTSDQLAAAQEEEARLDAQLSNAQMTLKTLESRINITSPIEGIFTNRQVSTGQDVSEGQTVGRIIDTGKLIIEASLFPPSGTEIQGKDVTIRLSENRTLNGIVLSILPQASGTGATSIWIEGSGIESLRPGQMVEGDIVTGTGLDNLAVPESAIVYDSHEQAYLFFYQNGTYQPLSIRIGLEQDGWIEVISGLKQDQLVVTQGAYELFYRKFNEQFRVQD
jgi:RND family efflux transporter MFP subunit